MTHPPSGGKMSKDLGESIGCVGTKTLYCIKGFLNVVTWSKQYIGEKPTVLLYTDIDRHAGTPKSQSRNTVSLGVQYIWTKSSGLK